MKRVPEQRPRNQQTCMIETAMATWGQDGELPDWVAVLATACDDLTPSTVAKRTAFSPLAVSQIINKSYGGDWSHVEQTVRGALMAETASHHDGHTTARGGQCLPSDRRSACDDCSATQTDAVHTQERQAVVVSLANNMGLPDLLCEIAVVAGIEATLQLALARGGNRIYIPEYASDNHWLVQCVGREAADKICKHFSMRSGIEIELPIGPFGRRGNFVRQLHRMIEAGRTSTEITRELGISRRTVSRHRRRMRQGG